MRQGVREGREGRRQAGREIGTCHLAGFSGACIFYFFNKKKCFIS